MSTSSILLAEGPHEWRSPANNPSSFKAPKITPQAQKLWTDFLRTYEPPESFQFYCYYQGPRVVFNRAWDGGSVTTENKGIAALAVNIVMIWYTPPTPAAASPQSPPPSESLSLGRAGVTGIINALLDRGSQIGAAFAQVPKDVGTTITDILTGDFEHVSDVASVSGRRLVDALLGLDGPIPPAPAPPPDGFWLLIIPGQSILDSAGDYPDNEIYGDEDGPVDDGGGGNDGVSLPDPDLLLNLANRIAALLQSFLDPSKALADRLGFVTRLADAVGAIAKTLGSLVNLADTIKDFLNDGNGNQKTGQALSDAIDLLTPLMSEIVGAIVSEMFKASLAAIKEAEKNKDKTTESSDDCCVDQDLLDRYFLTPANQNVATVLGAVTAPVDLYPYEVEY